MNKKPTFGERFKELRDEKGLTQGELVNLFNNQNYYSFNTSSISMYENGKQIPEVSVLEKWADFFGVTMDYLLGRSNIRTEYDPNKMAIPNSMDIYKRIIEVADSANISTLELERDTKLDNGTIESWKEIIPPGDEIQRVAIALGTTIEYLLLGVNDISEERRVIARKLNNINDADLDMIDSIIETIEKRNKNK